ncbi:EamA family transporter [Metallumcola ferriviriculae]|uniref:EamA family transporter n=1 Tax=Metallumcola ferriviriculae TaxID=3039180 RepID=A0AAU0UPD0_9FIRM|nr:EamA family transporter [Desulfitibacteraceae bacterium MK1]
MANLLVILLSVVFGSVGQVLIKMGMKKFGSISAVDIWAKLLQVFLIPEIPLGFICFGISAVLWLAVLSKTELSYAYPLVSLNYVFILLLSAWLFKEHISLFRVTGLLFILAGVTFISRS